jgi:predicted permease
VQTLPVCGSRNREFAVRAAVGAGRGRLLRQLLTETLLLSVAGGAFGMLLAKWLVQVIAHLDALALPGVGEIRLDGMVLGFTVALSIATGILFGLFPSLKASRPDLAEELRVSGAAYGSAAPQSIFGVTTRGLLVVAQISLSIILLIGATLLLKSFARLRQIDPGFQSAHVLTMKIALPPARYDTNLKKSTFFRELVRRVEGAPGVESAAVAMSLPTIAEWLGTNVSAEGQPPDDGDAKSPSARLQSVTPDYFRTLQIPLRRGREFTARDTAPDAPAAVIINESFARRFWPTYPRGRSPVGQHMREGIDRTGWIEIVGIVADVREGDLTAPVEPEFYVPTVIHAPQTAYLAVRTASDTLSLASTIRKQILAIDGSQPVSDIKTMDQVLEAALGQRRLTMWLLGSFAGVALLLAIIGMYGVIAYSVARRTQEVGIRRALGAQQADILRLVLRQGLALALAGVAVGIAGAFALTRVMQGLLFQVTATDPATFIGIAILFLIAALAASYIPARRAARIDPMAALRIG